MIYNSNNTTNIVRVF